MERGTMGLIDHLVAAAAAAAAAGDEYRERDDRGIQFEDGEFQGDDGGGGGKGHNIRDLK
jgi:hypothetical protein